MKKVSIIIVHGRTAKPEKSIFLKSCKSSIVNGIKLKFDLETAEKWKNETEKNNINIDLVYYADLLGYKPVEDLYFESPKKPYRDAFEKIIKTPIYIALKALYILPFDIAINLFIKALRKLGIDFGKLLDDVEQYFNNPKTRKGIFQRFEEVVEKHSESEEIILVGHSLGSIVTYEYLKSKKDLKKFKFVTMGSPIGLQPVLNNLKKPRPFTAQIKWDNFYDPLDVTDALCTNLKKYFGSVEGHSIINKYDFEAITDKLGKNNSGFPFHYIYGYLEAPEFAKYLYKIIFNDKKD